jgi:hypothetical protein
VAAFDPLLTLPEVLSALHPPTCNENRDKGDHDKPGPL